MDTYDNRKVLVVFIGSPGDVAEERQTARKAVDRVNRTLKTIGWQIDLRGWEDTLPGHGRPQELINADVQACKLFIGLLYARWGSPSGKYSSGFEEEYRLALELRKRQDAPEIWLFFKKVPAAQMKDPGEQLRKVLEFRQEVTSGQEVLFKDIRGTEWKELLPEMLLEYILKLNQRDSPRLSDAFTPAPPASGLAISPVDPATTSPLVPPQLSETLSAAAAHALSPKELGAFQAARLHLFATTALTRYNSSGLGVHETNQLYLHRAELDATPWEQDLLYRTVVGGGGDVFPGWYWFADHDAAMTKRFLLMLVMGPSDERTRARSAELLSGSSIQPEMDGISREEIVSQLLDDPSAEVKRANVDYLGKVGVMADLPALVQLNRDEDGQVRSKAEEAHSLILARNDPGRILTEVIGQRQVLYKSIAKELAGHASDLDTAELKAAVDHDDPAVRLFAAQLLEKRGALPSDLAQRFTKDPSNKVKAVGYRELLRSGTLVTMEGIESGVHDAIKDRMVQVMGSQPVETLKEQIELYSTSGLIAYEALARHHFDQFADRLRSDLSDGFEVMRSDWVSKLERFAPAVDELLQSFKKGGGLDRFMRWKFTAVALGALAQQGEQRDAAFGRKYLTSGEEDVRLASIALLERFGDESDCNRLLESARGEWSTREAAAKVAVKLAKGSMSMIRSLLDSDDLRVVRVAIGSLEPKDLPAMRSRLLDLLQHESDGVRVLAVAGLYRLTDRTTLEAILNEYMGNRTYYYNVVCWLDRVLYAPEPIKEMYVRALDQGGINLLEN
jgi:HEAT repeat protein